MVDILISTIGIAAIWFAKQVLAVLIGQQVKGSIPDYAARKAQSAAQKLPPELREAYEVEWVAELATLDSKPMTAIRYSHGLGRAASEIAREMGVHNPASRVSLLASRGRDVASSAALLFLLAPLLLAIALCALLLHRRRRPVLSRISEPGKDGRPFSRLRFTTIKRMPDGGYAHTRLGLVLARTSLQELPALLNVLRGDLAFVGPPSPFEVLDDDELFSPKVRPGIVSWQVLAASGLGNMSKEDAKYRDEHRTLRNDITLMLRSARAVLRAEYHPAND